MSLQDRLNKVKLIRANRIPTLTSNHVIFSSNWEYLRTGKLSSLELISSEEFKKVHNLPYQGHLKVTSFFWANLTPLNDLAS